MIQKMAMYMYSPQPVRKYRRPNWTRSTRKQIRVTIERIWSAFTIVDECGLCGLRERKRERVESCAARVFQSVELKVERDDDGGE